MRHLWKESLVPGGGKAVTVIFRTEEFIYSYYNVSDNSNSPQH